MSVLEELQISGIRSVGPNDPVQIKFFKPLTVIVGQNGSGKTTLIESLRYATTGDFPPNARTSFVHDPKLADAPTVSAQVCLQFMDATGISRTAVRLLKATSTAKNVSIKCLDSSIKWEVDGDVQAHPYKDADYKQEMAAYLHVPEAVLKSVIFCHQDESNWPLGENKSVKETFDKIFGAERYTKALEEIRKIQKDLGVKQKGLEDNLKYIEEKKKCADRWKKELAETEEQLEQVQAEIAIEKEKRPPIQEEIKKLNGEMDCLADIARREGLIKGARDMIELQIAETAQTMSHILKDLTIEELETQKGELVEKCETLKAENGKIHKEILQIAKDIKEQEKQMRSYNQEVGKLEKEKSDYEDLLKERNEVLVASAKDMAIEGFDSQDDIDDSKEKQFTDKVNEKLQNIIAEMKAETQKYNDDEKDISARIKANHEEIVKRDTSIKMKGDQKKKALKEITDTEKLLAKVDSNKTRLMGLNEDLQEAEKRLEEHKTTLDVEETKIRIKELEDKKKELDTKIRELDQEQEEVAKLAQQLTTLEHITKEQTSKQTQLDETWTKHMENLKTLFGEDFQRGPGLKKKMADWIKVKDRELKAAQKERNKVDINISTKQNQVRSYGEEKKRKEEEVQSKTERIRDKCGDQKLADKAFDVSIKIDKERKKHSRSKGIREVFKGFIENIETADQHCCPICTTDLTSNWEDVTQRLNKEIEDVPTKIEKLEENIKALFAEERKLNDLKPVHEAVEKIKTKDIPELEKKMEEGQAAIEVLRQEKEVKDEALKVVENQMEVARVIQQDAQQMDAWDLELKELKRKLDRMDQSGSLEGRRKLHEIQEEKEEKMREREAIDTEHSDKNNRVFKYQDVFNKCTAEVTNLRQERVNLQEDISRQRQLEEKKLNLDREVEDLEKAVEELRDEKRPFEDKTAELNEEKSDRSRAKEILLSDLRNTQESYAKKKTAIHNMTTKLQEYVRRGRAGKLTDASEMRNGCETKIQAKKEEKEGLEGKQKTNDEQIIGQDSQKRNIEDNIKLQKNRKEVEKKNEELKQLKEETAGRDLAAIEEQLGGVKGQMKKIDTKIYGMEMEKVGHDKSIQQFKKNLNSKEYKTIDEDYGKQLIQVVTTEQSKKDLANYHTVLKTAMSEFHKLKMHEINKIVKELWRTTYQGNDIEWIEIVTDVEEDTKIKTEDIGRQTYNYRVVMLKNGRPLDMRGRCSAGQKVLASLMIRLALAETFCQDCGVLALDEPTTNLDRENIESLAKALTDIIHSRRSRSFQLIVITHDEDFVELLGRSEFVEEFHYVSRNNQGLSCVETRDVSSLNN